LSTVVTAFGAFAAEAVVSWDSASAKRVSPLGAWAARRVTLGDGDDDCSILMSRHLRR
jgi:hypothetical protein